MRAEPTLQGRRCPACGGELRSWRRVPSSEPALGSVQFTLARCRRCGSALTIEPAPAGSHELGAYGGGQPRLYRAVAPLLSRFDRRRLSLLRTLAPPGARLLDVGAGRGRFVLSALRAGYDASGIEPSERGLAGAVSLGAPVVGSDIAGAAIVPGSLDAVTLWHVLEHLEDPGGGLERIGEWLTPGGVLLVGVPNLGSLQAGLGGRRWYHLDVPRHRTHFTEPGLHQLLERHGFDVRRTVHVLGEHNPFGMWQSLVNRITTTPSYLYHLLKRNAPLRAGDLILSVLALPLAPVAAVLELLAGAARRGGTMAVLAVVAKRPGAEERRE